MNYIGIDIGTTSICAIMVSSVSGYVEKIEVANDSFIESEKVLEKIQDPEQIYEKVKKILDIFIDKYPRISGIGVTGQMHGILYLNDDGDSVSPLYTWQDKRGNPRAIVYKTGHEISYGYGLLTHYDNILHGNVPESAVSLCTIPDYIAMKLVGIKRPLMHHSNACSLGLYDYELADFDKDALEKLALDRSFLPKVTRACQVIGKTKENIDVSLAIGDNQASFIGAVKDMEASILVNIGTGSQLSLIAKDTKRIDGIELRPLVDYKHLYVGAAICGGRAYADLKKFYQDLLSEFGIERVDIFEVMERMASNADESLDVQTTFSGSRSDPSQRGSILGISDSNFTPGNLTLGFIDGIVHELYQMFQAIITKENAYNKVIVSGNGVRKNKLMQARIESIFKMPVLMTEHKEEAAFGAALFSGLATGNLDSLEAGQSLIKYKKSSL